MDPETVAERYIVVLKVGGNELDDPDFLLGLVNAVAAVRREGHHPVIVHGGGKAVTVVRGLALDAAALDALGKRLRSACGSGGTVKDGVIEVQGDHCDQVMQALGKQGFTAKRAGG